MKIGPFETGRVYAGDCLELMKALPDNSVPMIWTDPPFGHNSNDGDLSSSRVGIKGARQAPAIPIANDSPVETEAVMVGMAAEAGRILNTKVSCCCCCCCRGGGPDPSFARQFLRFGQKPWAFFHAVVWDKSAGGNGLGWRYRRNYEFILVAHRHGGTLAWAEGQVATPNIVRFTPVRGQEKSHPNEKPVELVEHFLRLHTQPGDLVLDPFAGSGTTGVACARLGREFLGFEIDPAWTSTANARIVGARRGLSLHQFRSGQRTVFEALK